MKSINLKIFLILFINIVSFNCINAQTTPPPKGLTKADRAEQMTTELNEKLKFDTKQSEAITAVHLSFLETMEVQRKDFDKKNPKAKLKVLDKIKELNTNKENSIKKLLNPSQLEIYNNWLSETKAVKKESLDNPPAKAGEVKEGVRPKASDIKYK